jgi:D-beta-D-heptose 7-phosphate kinase/D-beta-D-heptose 1-phosphate adenosyltransferase
MKYKRLYNLDTKNILIIGDIMLDSYLFGQCNRISPEAPVPVVEFSKQENMLGGAGNVLKNLVSFGARCEIISVVGDDLPGKIVEEELVKLDIQTQLLFIDKTRKTTVKKRIISSGQQLIRIDKEDRHPINIEIEESIISFVKDNVFKFDVIIFSDYLKGVLTEKVCLEIIKIAKANNVLTLVDPKGVSCNKYKNIDLIKPNLKEAEILIGRKIITNDEIKSACLTLQEMLGCKYVVITLAEKGVAFLSDVFDIIPTQSTEVFDVSGAGDTVLASLSICLIQNYSLRDSCDFSNKAASIVVKKFGSTTTTINEIDNLKKT